MAVLDEQLVKDTFEDAFDEVKYKKFLSELSGKSINGREDKTQYMSKGYADYIKSVIYCGNYSDEDYEQIGFYIIELKKQSSLSRARTMQRNVIAHFLRNSSDDCALVAFYEKGSEDWRFSFASLNYEIDEKGKINEKLTPAKRHSFLVGRNESNYTCKKQFFDLLAKGKILVKDIENAFNIENVTEEFFKEYKGLFLDLVDEINKIIQNDEAVATEFENKQIKVSDFAKKLLGQIVFLYFVQKKGWLGVSKDGQWGEGPKNFMDKLFNGDYIKYEKNKFFDDVIEPLFYQGLSEGVSDYHYSQFNCMVPFLNGGLFENLNGYDWENTDLVIPDDVFGRIFSVFNKFNFTVKEDEPLDREVAVDPEMLGKVFENLLEIKDRKSKGAFYTPRYIVHYMCQQSLISYLDSNTENIPIEDITYLIEKGHLALDSIVKAQEQAKKYNGNVYAPINLPKSIIDNAALLDNLLLNIKVVDPAVGSGAFPVGMMTEIVQAREVLNTLQGFDVFLYDLKRETIENSLYGVDISNSATDITKLRFWLSLIVDEESIDDIRPLPNLDNHIMCGNSLIDGFKGVKLFEENLIQNKDPQTTLTMKGSEIAFRNLEKLKLLFFNENNPNEKLKLKRQIEDIKWKFIEESFKEAGHEDELDELNKYKNSPSKPFFIWELEFSEVFSGENPGFDIVIGNPPYFNIEKLGNNSDYAEYLKNYYNVYMDKSDILFYFIERAIKISKRYVEFIISNAFLFADKGINLRNYIIDNAPISSIINFENYKVFKAGISTAIVKFDKNKDDTLANALVLPNTNYKENDLVKIFKNQDDYFKVNFTKNSNFPLISETKKVLNEKIDENCEKLGDLFLIGQGMASGADKVFSFKEKPTQFPQEFIKKRVTGTNLTKYHVNDNNYPHVLYFEDIKEFNKLPTSIQNHLKANEEKLRNRADKKRRKTSKWWNYTFPLHKDLYHLPKLFCSRRAKTNVFAMDDGFNWLCLGNITIVFGNNDKLDLRYVLCLLNSNLLTYRYQSIGKMTGANSYEYFPNGVGKLPIKVIDKKDQEIFIKLAIEIDNLKTKLEHIENSKEKKVLNQKISNNEAKINELVYELYGLSEDEIQFVEKSILE